MITVIGKLDDLKKFDDLADIDSWRKSGRIPKTSDPPVTWAENKQWLDERIARGDQFGLATDPEALPAVKAGYIPGKPNGYFTAREREYLESLGIEILKMWS
jgi:hypothetical protein